MTLHISVEKIWKRKCLRENEFNYLNTVTALYTYIYIYAHIYKNIYENITRDSF